MDSYPPPPQFVEFQEIVQELEKQLLWTRKVLNTVCYYIQNKWGHEDDLPKEILKPEYWDDCGDYDKSVPRRPEPGRSTRTPSADETEFPTPEPVYIVPVPYIVSQQSQNLTVEPAQRQRPKPSNRTIRTSRRTKHRHKPNPYPNLVVVQYPCNNCDELFDTSNQLSVHEITQHDNCFVKLTRLDEAEVFDGNKTSFLTSSYGTLKKDPLEVTDPDNSDEDDEDAMDHEHDNDYFVGPDSEEESSSSSSSSESDDEEFIPSSNPSEPQARRQSHSSTTRKIYPCHAQSRELLYQKERGTFYCDHCEGASESYGRMDILMRHKDLVHPDKFDEELRKNRISRKQLVYACPICEDNYFGRKVLGENHVVKFHPAEAKTSSPIETIFENEYEVPLDGKAKGLKCRQCPKGNNKFTNAAQLKIHKLRVHMKARPGFSGNRQSLTVHKKPIKTGDSEFEDDNANDQFGPDHEGPSGSSKPITYLQSSKFLSKKERGTFYCDYCELTPDNNYNRMNHLMLHKDLIHPEQFSKELKNNRISRKQLVYACKFCFDTYFGRQAYCVKHLKNFHPQEATLNPVETIFENEFVVLLKDDEELKCRLCPESEANVFGNPAELKIHKLKCHGHLNEGYQKKQQFTTNKRRKMNPREDSESEEDEDTDDNTSGSDAEFSSSSGESDEEFKPKSRRRRRSSNRGKPSRSSRNSMSTDSMSRKYLPKKNRGTFYCDYCERTPHNSYSLMNHLILHKDLVHPEKLAEELNKNRISRKQVAYSCSLCDDTFFGMKSLCERHFNHFHPEEAHTLSPVETLFENEFVIYLNDGDLKCRHCPESEAKEYPNPAHLKLHKLKFHFRKHPPGLKRKRKAIKKFLRLPKNCEICNQTFKNSLQYLRHLKSDHPPEYGQIIESDSSLKELSAELSPTFCKQCKTELNTEVDYDAHNAQFHCHTCDICNKIFRKPKYLEKHKTVVHEGRRGLSQFVCEICGSVYTRKDTLNRHMEGTHGGEAKYACHLCPYKGKLEMLLKIHLKNQHKIFPATHGPPPPPQQCELCGEFIKRGMKRHLDSVHRGIRRFSCQFSDCDKSFKTNSALKYHLQTHEKGSWSRRALNKEREPIRRKGRVSNPWANNQPESSNNENSECSSTSNLASQN